MELELFSTHEQQYVIEFECNPYELDVISEELSFDGNIHIVCKIDKDADIIRIRGEVQLSMIMECARCLAKFIEAIKGEFELVVQKLRKSESLPLYTEDKIDDEETRLIYLEYGKKTIDITNYVRDALILSIPLKTLCKKDCKGLCDVCGCNLNEGECGCSREMVDLRWEKLRDFSVNEK